MKNELTQLSDWNSGFLRNQCSSFLKKKDKCQKVQKDFLGFKPFHFFICKKAWGFLLASKSLNLSGRIQRKVKLSALMRKDKKLHYES